ncbi:hypothetical protein [Actinomadura roseirufa]|uniref:hypothetical protein n=1 Tax=Actinomadura roseirufa TaxID=2094049 RepID=UPI0010411F18|nr:hypothetical protein [Actinomadura roseirufa]
MLLALARWGEAPSALDRTSARGVPVRAVNPGSRHSTLLSLGVTAAAVVAGLIFQRLRQGRPALIEETPDLGAAPTPDGTA